MSVKQIAWEYEPLETEDKSEHGMGMEMHHQYSIEGYECPHPGCSASIDAKVDVWEYPNGSIATSDKTENVVGKVDDCFAAQLD